MARLSVSLIATPIELGLNEFESRLESLLKDIPEHDLRANGLLAALYETGLSIRLFRQKNLAAAHHFVCRWLRLARKHGVKQEKLCAFEQHFVGAVVIRAALPDLDESPDVTFFHDLLERFYLSNAYEAVLEKALDEVVLEKALDNDTFHGFYSAISTQTDVDSFPIALRNILAAKTSRTQLSEAYKAAEEGCEIDTSLPIFQTEAGQRLLKAFQTDNWQRKVVIAKNAKNGPACGARYENFGREEANQFETRRFAQCIHCNAFTLNLFP